MPIDKSKYPKNWVEISRRIRFLRAKNSCEKCGVGNYSPHPVTGSIVILTVAHLNHDTKDNREENLMALCQKCHLGHDRTRNVSSTRRTIFKRKFGMVPNLPFLEEKI